MFKSNSNNAQQDPGRLKKWFDGLEPARKRKVTLMGIAAIGFTIIVTVSAVTPDNRGKKKPNQADSKRTTPNLLQTQTEQLGLDAMNTDVRSLQDQVKALQSELERTKNEPKSPPAAPVAPAQGPDAALEAMRNEIVASPEYKAPAGTTLNPDRPSAGGGGGVPARPSRPGSSGPQQAAAQPPAPVMPTMKVVRGKAPAAAPVPEVKPSVPDVYLPTGSVMTGVLLNGLDAPTGRNAQGQPVPVVVRVKHEAILPSRYRSDVREAFVLAAGFGDLSSERAYLRAERLSMILNDGRIIDVPIKMAAVGQDGKTGIRGTLVSKQGALIAKALMAGTAEGVSRAFGGTSYGSLSTGGYDLPSSSELATRGIAGGTSSALDRVASYFLQQAEAMYPVIEVSAGREVSFILLEGTNLSTVPRSSDQTTAETSPPSTGALPARGS